MKDNGINIMEHIHTYDICIYQHHSMIVECNIVVFKLLL